MKKWIIAIVCIALVMPILLGILVSIPSVAWLKTSNDWIGFWGSYAGAIIGGLITCIIFCNKRNIKMLDLLDFMAPALALRTSNRKMGEFC